MHSLDIVGDADGLPAARTAAPTSRDPASFTEGTAVARFDLTLQDVLAVFAPGPGAAHADRRHAADEGGRARAARLSGRRFGVNGQRLRMFATGLGTLVDP